MVDNFGTIPPDELERFINELRSNLRLMHKNFDKVKDEFQLVSKHLGIDFKRAEREWRRRESMTLLQTIQDCIDKKRDWFLFYYNEVYSEIVDVYPWSYVERVVLEYKGEYVEVTYSIPATVHQRVDFDHKARAVVPVEKTVTVYEPLASEALK